MSENSGQAFYDASAYYAIAAYGSVRNAPRPYSMGGTLPGPSSGNPYYHGYAMASAIGSGFVGGGWWHSEPKPEPGALKSSWSSTAVRGYRTWAEPGKDDEGKLRGAIWRLTEWTSPITHAACIIQASPTKTPCDPGMSPNPQCDCGLYAWHLPDEVFGSKVFGVVEGAGRVLWAKGGWRAQKTRILALHHPHPATAEQIAARHPEATMFPTVDALLDVYPPLIDPSRVYGPQGAAIRRVVVQAAAMSGEQVHEVNLPYVYKATPACNERMDASALAHRTGFTVRRAAAPPWLRANHIAEWAYRAVMVADRIPAATYELLVAPWRSVFGDPLPEYTPPESSAGAVEAFPEASGPSGPKTPTAQGDPQ